MPKIRLDMYSPMKPEDPYEVYESNASLEDGLSGRLKERSFDYSDHPSYPERTRHVGCPSTKRREDCDESKH
jgi:hypothetical protein